MVTLFFHDGVETVELCELRQHTLERAVGEDELCNGQHLHGGLEAKDEDVITVVFQKVMRFLLDEVFQFCHLTFLFHCTETSHVDSISRHFPCRILHHLAASEMCVHA